MSDAAIKRPPAGMPKEVLFAAAALIALTVIGATIGATDRRRQDPRAQCASRPNTFASL